MRTTIAARSTAKAPDYFMNRRIRNRTYGGVGGREPRGSLLPDVRPFTGRIDRPSSRASEFSQRATTPVSSLIRRTATPPGLGSTGKERLGRRRLVWAE